ncbi:helix-turn-helix domain-containing protein [Ornithobacterium rhinotracheale]|uniref:helix-turn-helix domain-containing protein n=1 Tax=Ornithobacterium rhinotracheale TaxID=28251 RepID=UPI003FA42E49
MMKKELTINERILYLIENQVNGNQKKFAEKINFAPQVIYNIVSGRKSKPSFDVLNAILSSFVYINAEWLLTGKGEMLKTETKNSQKIKGDGNIMAGIGSNIETGKDSEQTILQLKKEIKELNKRLLEKDEQINKLINILSNGK